MAAEHDVPYPGETAAAWVPSSTAVGWLQTESFRVLQGGPASTPQGDVLAIAYTATDPRAVFTYQEDGKPVSYSQDTLLYLFDPVSGTAWIGGISHEDIRAGLDAGRPLN